jgi:4-hydroxymandelate oxidase
MAARSASEWEAEARQRLDPAVYDFFAGGADDEITLRANESAFAQIALLPRVLRGGVPELGIELLGCRCSLPLLIAPTAFHRLAHPEGECATARAAAAAGTIMIVSMASTVAIEEVAASVRAGAAVPGAALWFQLSIQPDLDFTEAIVRRAEAAGAKALVVTVDAPVFGRRARDLRNGFLDLPPGMYCENLREARAGGAASRVRAIEYERSLRWEHLDWLRERTALPIALKGVTHPDDALLALERGVDALIVSNHGGRQLDSVPASITLLPAIARAVARRVPVLLDGGIRRGTDMVKALCLGADAVAIGRPVLWGLGAGGAEGVRVLLEWFRTDFDRALALCGCRSLDDLTPELVRC